MGDPRAVIGGTSAGEKKGPQSWQLNLKLVHRLSSQGPGMIGCPAKAKSEFEGIRFIDPREQESDETMMSSLWPVWKGASKGVSPGFRHMLFVWNCRSYDMRLSRSQARRQRYYRSGHRVYNSTFPIPWPSCTCRPRQRQGQSIQLQQLSELHICFSRPTGFKDVIRYGYRYIIHYLS